MGQEGHAIHRPHGDVDGPSHIHRHWGGYCDWMSDIHGRGGRDVDRGNVDRPSDGDWVLEAHWRCDVDCVGANVHLCRYGYRVVLDAPVHSCGDGG